MDKHTTAKLGNVIEIDQTRVQEHLGELVWGSVEETLNALLDAKLIMDLVTRTPLPGETAETACNLDQTPA